MALIMSSLWCWGRLCFGSRLAGTIVGCCVVVLLSCIPSGMDSRAYRVRSSCGVATSISGCIWKSLTGFLSMSMLMIGYPPALWLFNRSWTIFKLMLCLDVLSLESYLHPPKRYVFVSGWLHLPHSIGPYALCYFLHR
jgi:hypothetical protein